MISYWKLSNQFQEFDGRQPGCWTCLTVPTAEDMKRLREMYDIPEWFFEDISDADERPRHDSEDGWQLVIVRIPYPTENNAHTPFITVPLGIIFKGDVLVTICHFKVQMMHDFIEEQKTKGPGIIDTVDFIFKIFYFSSIYYLKYLRIINQRIDGAKRNLDSNIDNKSLISLSRLQDSLTYFITSLKGNSSLLSKLKFKLPIDALDSDTIEDVDIEMSQALEMSQIYSTILDSTINTYSNVISNNVNSTMKVLTSVSIILMLPTLIASFMGMNLINGMEDWVWGFPLIFAFSVLISLIGWLIFKRKRLM